MKSEHIWLGGIAMTDYPRSPVSFQQRFPNGTAGAAYLMATHSNGISAFQLWRQLGLVHPGGIPDPIRRASELLGRRCAALVMD
jgi:hypothetical protein